jgi:hypothetical protein
MVPADDNSTSWMSWPDVAAYWRWRSYSTKPSKYRSPLSIRGYDRVMWVYSNVGDGTWEAFTLVAMEPVKLLTINMLTTVVDYCQEVRVVWIQLDMYRDHGGYILTEVREVWTLIDRCPLTACERLTGSGLFKDLDLQITWSAQCQIYFPRFQVFYTSIYTLILRKHPKAPRATMWMLQDMHSIWVTGIGMPTNAYGRIPI